MTLYRLSKLRDTFVIRLIADRVTSCCYADPFDLEPGHTSTFDCFAQKDGMSANPTSFSLSFLWLAITCQRCQTHNEWWNGMESVNTT